MTIIYSMNGQDHVLNSPEDVGRMLGYPDRNMVMIDESGEIVGAGSSVGRMMDSQPLVKALLHKPTPRQLLAKSISNRRVLFPAKKTNNKFQKTLNELEALRKGMTVAVTNVEDSSTDIEDLWSAIIEISDTLDQVTNYLKAVIAAVLLPDQA